MAPITDRQPFTAQASASRRGAADAAFLEVLVGLVVQCQGTDADACEQFLAGLGDRLRCLLGMPPPCGERGVEMPGYGVAHRRQPSRYPRQPAV